MYKIVGTDGQQYGPVTAEQLRQWILERRVSAQTLVQAEGAGDWRPLSGFPEFAEALTPPDSAAPPLSGFPSPSALPPFATPAGLPTGDYALDISGCVANGWNLFKNNLGLLLGGMLVYVLIEAVFVGLGMIPFVGPLFSILNIFVIGPLVGGLFYLFLQVLRGRPATVGDVFAGFRLRYLQLFLGQLVSGLLAGLCLLPAVVVGLLAVVPSLMRNQPPGPGRDPRDRRGRAALFHPHDLLADQLGLHPAAHH